MFDLQGPRGQRIRGGIRALHLTDESTGESFEIATIRPDAVGELIPPNQIVYRDAFIGLLADVVLIYRADAVMQDVVIREKPVLPQGSRPENVYFEAITELVDPPAERIVGALDPPRERVDHPFIRFQDLTILPGKAFPVDSDTGISLGNFNPSLLDRGTRVRKQWHRLPNGQRFVVEAVKWNEIAPHFERLAAAQTDPRALAAGARWPEPRRHSVEGRPILLASAPYQPDGYLLDLFFKVIPDETITTPFETGETYYIRTSYYSGNPANFPPGCVFKYKTNANMVLFGSITFADTLQSPVFTSRNDRSFGEDIIGVAGELNSDGNPSLHLASQALWIYYVSNPVTIQSARFRWAQRGIQFDMNPGVYVTHQVKNTHFEKFPTGSVAIHLNLQNASLTLSGVTKGGFSGSAISGSGSVSGTITDSLFHTDSGYMAVRSSEDTSGTYFRHPPDTIGSVSSTYSMTMVNCYAAANAKADGARMETATAAALFGYSGVNNRDLADPRVVYNHYAGRWIATILHIGGKTVYIAISPGTSPLNFSQWQRYSVSLAEPDHPTLGPYGADYPITSYDKNGVYIATRVFVGDAYAPAVWMHKIIPIRVTGTAPNVTFTIKPIINFNDSRVYPGGYSLAWIFPATSYDSTLEDAWFIAKGAPGTTHGGFIYNRLVWDQNGNASFVGSPRFTGSLAIPEAYYDFDRNRFYNIPQKPKAGANQTINDLNGGWFHNPIIRGGFLWTCHHIGLDGGDNLYNGGTVDRIGIAWYKLKIKSDNTLSLASADGAASGRIYDTASSNPYHFYFPSLAVNANGDMVIGFSGSRSTEHVGSFYTGRRGSNGAMLPRIMLLQAGRDYYESARFGDYSATIIDPSNDGWWSFQSSAERWVDEFPQSQFGAWIHNIRKGF